MFPLIRRHCYLLEGCCRLHSEKNLASVARRFYRSLRSCVRCSAKDDVASIDGEKKPYSIPSDVLLRDAQVLYSVAPAMGHNKVFPVTMTSLAFW